MADDHGRICSENCGGNVTFCRKGVGGFDNSPVELRGNTPKWIIEVLDAEALADDKSRIDLVNSILEPWALKRLHAAKLLSRITRSNGRSTESGGGTSE